jgi:AAA15 family ATPase/GTPase
MKLIRLTYESKNWDLKDLELGDTNLIVGKNATGKSRTLLAIDFLYQMITQKIGIDWGVKWDITFKTKSNDFIVFKFNSKYTNEGVTSEEIIINNEKVLQRTSKEAQIKNYLTGEFDEINPPDNKLVIHVNRDVKKYPYLEEIATWAENSYGFKFGNISPFGISSFGRPKRQEYDLLTSIENIPKLFKELNKRNTKELLKDLETIGYGNVSKLSFEDDDFTDTLIVNETDLNINVPHHRLSQGMFRALSVLIFLEYLTSKKQPATVVIDDLCEGLDYDRATKLGKLVFLKCEQNDIQLVATSNDMFLMDVVDIHNWNILQRKGKLVTALNSKNSPELFENFSYTGLSNFDFFSSDYISKKLK